MRAASFAGAGLIEGAAALNRVFEQYLLPVDFSPEQLYLHIAYNDIVPELSPIWVDESGEVIAAALLGIRERRAWIGGFGVAPEYRGRGYAAKLVEHLLAVSHERGMIAIGLEVLCDNAAAIAVYRRAGFATVRRLFSFKAAIEDGGDAVGFENAPIERLLEPEESPSPCWQRENAALRNGAVSTGVHHEDGTYALFRHNDATAQVLKLHACSPERLAALANAVAQGRRCRTLVLLNEPEQSPVVRCAREAGWDEPFAQYEMRMEL